MPELDIPPPSCPAELLVNVQLARVGLLLNSLYIPPPEVLAELPVNVQLVRVGLLEVLYIPPPLPLL